MKRLRVEQLQHAPEHFLAGDAHHEIEPELGRVRRQRVDIVSVLVMLLGDDEEGIGTGTLRVLRRPAAAPEDRQLRRVADAAERAAHDHAFRAVSLGRARGLGAVDLDDDRDPVALGDRLTEPSASPFGQE